MRWKSLSIGALASVLGFIACIPCPYNWTWPAEHLLRHLLERLGYTEAIYYFGMIIMMWPWHVAAIILGLGIGIRVRDRWKRIATTAAVGFLLVPMLLCFTETSQALSLPYLLSSLAWEFASVPLVLFSAWCGAKIVWPRNRWNNARHAGSASL